MTNIAWFRDIGMGDLLLVGGKNASLGEMYRELSSQGIVVPNGFAITTNAYRKFLHHNNMETQIDGLLQAADTRDSRALTRLSKKIHTLILAAELPGDLQTEIIVAYNKLGKDFPQAIRVAVRSSATAEDLDDASFAGQQETFLNISGEKNILQACKECFASLFTARAISYRKDKGFGATKIALSIGVQQMVRSDIACSGVMFTIDTETGFRDVVLINGSYGLGEAIVKGAVVPDEYLVFKPLLNGTSKPILQKRLGSKDIKLIRERPPKSGIKSKPVLKKDRECFALADDEVLQLARWACIIEEHYSKKNGHHTPMDIEWAKDGLTEQLFIVQARPETIHSQHDGHCLETYKLLEKGTILASGRAIGEKIGAGPACIITNVRDLPKLKKGDVLVSDQTDPDWEPAMKLASAIVTNRGGRTCHAAIVARELGVPAVVGCYDATKTIAAGEAVTVSCAEGENGVVFRSRLKFKIDRTDLTAVELPKTKVMMILANPHEAFKLSFIPNEGIGLVREEFIIANLIKIHPMALINFKQLKDKKIRARINELTQGYADKPQFFVDQLAQGVAMIGAAFFPKDVIVRFSDFKTNEYANLIGGAAFEPHEENPMIGFRGASRYYDDRFRAAFALECRAIKKVRDEIGLTNVKVMIPFCRTVQEGNLVLAEMEANGLTRGENGLEVYVMCEIPSNVMLAAEFADIFDGFSIGSNDLTQLTLGIDRDSEILAPLFDERNAAVKKMVETVIIEAKKKGRKIGICGQAPSDFPEFTQFLVSLGIDSISLNPDSVLKTIPIIKKAENES